MYWNLFALPKRSMAHPKRLMALSNELLFRFNLRALQVIEACA
jgi:hypothetical protein